MDTARLRENARILCILQGALGNTDQVRVERNYQDLRERSRCVEDVDADAEEIQNAEARLSSMLMRPSSDSPWNKPATSIRIFAPESTR